MRGYKNRNNGFTLAEVLITLGIIGVVVAMTIPTLISKYKHKEYETRFKKAYSMLAQATYDLPIEYGRCDATNAQSINDYVFGKLKNINSGSFRSNGMSYKGNFKTYSLENTTSVIHPNCFDRASNQGSYNYIVTPDGITFSFCTNYSVGNSISVDINGINKGPNAFGHDLFFFRILMMIVNYLTGKVSGETARMKKNVTSIFNGQMEFVQSHQRLEITVSLVHLMQLQTNVRMIAEKVTGVVCLNC